MPDFDIRLEGSRYVAQPVKPVTRLSDTCQIMVRALTAWEAEHPDWEAEYLDWEAEVDSPPA